MNYGDQHTETCTVEQMDRASGGSSSMRLYTDCGVLSVDDRAFAGHFSSAEVYAQIKEGHTYEFDLIGRRVPILSKFPNVMSVHEPTTNAHDSGDHSHD